MAAILLTGTSKGIGYETGASSPRLFALPHFIWRGSLGHTVAVTQEFKDMSYEVIKEWRIKV